MMKQKYWLYRILILAVIGIVLISGCAKKIEEVVPPEDILEGNIPEITNYPKLEQVFIDLYAAIGLYDDDEFTEEEIDFMKVGLKIYKEKPELNEYPREALLYLMSRSGGKFEAFYDAEFFNQTLIPLAKEITAEAGDDLAAIKAISIWVNNNIEYGTSLALPSDIPKDVLTKKLGQCSGYSILIAGLSKAVGIPARIVSVRLMHSVYKRASHVWVEAYIDGDWIPIASTGALDLDNDVLIEYSELKHLENNKMLDVFIKSPYNPRHSRTDITFGYNNYVAQQMITEVQGMLEEDYNLEAKDNLESAKNKLLLWEKEKSTEDRNRIGREAMEHLLRAVAILKENIAGDEVQVAFLEDFPIVKKKRSREGEITSSFHTDGVMQSADIKNPLAFWEDFQKTLVETNPKALYLFDASYENKTIMQFAGDCHGIDFHMLQAIDELIKNEGLDTELNFVLYWSDEEYLETIEFLDYEDIEPVVTLNKRVEDNALDFMWDFIGAVNKVKDNVTKTNFYLPPKFEEKYDYRIVAMGMFIQEDLEFIGYTLEFGMIIETSIGELPLRLELYGIPGTTKAEQFPRYTNLIIVDESGNVLRPEEKDGKYYYSTCPGGFVNLNPGQNLIIEREGDFIKITETGKT